MESSAGRLCVRYAVLANTGLSCATICQDRDLKRWTYRSWNLSLRLMRQERSAAEEAVANLAAVASKPVVMTRWPRWCLESLEPLQRLGAVQRLPVAFFHAWVLVARCSCTRRGASGFALLHKLSERTWLRESLSWWERCTKEAARLRELRSHQQDLLRLRHRNAAAAAKVAAPSTAACEELSLRLLLTAWAGAAKTAAAASAETLLPAVEELGRGGSSLQDAPPKEGVEELEAILKATQQGSGVSQPHDQLQQECEELRRALSEQQGNFARSWRRMQEEQEELQRQRFLLVDELARCRESAAQAQEVACGERQELLAKLQLAEEKAASGKERLDTEISDEAQVCEEAVRPSSELALAESKAPCGEVSSEFTPANGNALASQVVCGERDGLSGELAPTKSNAPTGEAECEEGDRPSSELAPAETKAVCGEGERRISGLTPVESHAQELQVLSQDLLLQLGSVRARRQEAWWKHLHCLEQRILRQTTTSALRATFTAWRSQSSGAESFRRRQLLDGHWVPWDERRLGRSFRAWAMLVMAVGRRRALLAVTVEAFASGRARVKRRASFCAWKVAAAGAPAPTASSSVQTSPDVPAITASSSTQTSPDAPAPTASSSVQTSPDVPAITASSSTQTSPDAPTPTASSSVQTSPDAPATTASSSTQTSPDALAPTASSSTQTSPDAPVPTASSGVQASPDAPAPTASSSTQSSPDAPAPTASSSTQTSPDAPAPTASSSVQTSPDAPAATASSSTQTSPGAPCTDVQPTTATSAVQTAADLPTTATSAQTEPGSPVADSFVQATATESSAAVQTGDDLDAAWSLQESDLVTFTIDLEADEVRQKRAASPVTAEGKADEGIGRGDGGVARRIFPGGASCDETEELELARAAPGRVQANSRWTRRPRGDIHASSQGSGQRARPSANATPKRRATSKTAALLAQTLSSPRPTQRTPGRHNFAQDTASTQLSERLSRQVARAAVAVDAAKGSSRGRGSQGCALRRPPREHCVAESEISLLQLSAGLRHDVAHESPMQSRRSPRSSSSTSSRSPHSPGRCPWHGSGAAARSGVAPLYYEGPDLRFTSEAALSLEAAGFQVSAEFLPPRRLPGGSPLQSARDIHWALAAPEQHP
ncbi:HKR1 [Symbiodinium sp. CCMP2592]|nr:HKR1 [Symbiodinium sp. CCMP2592]